MTKEHKTMELPDRTRGKSFECCFCKHRCKISDLLPMGVQGRLVVCPNCRSFDRERNVFLFLKDHTNLFSGSNLRLLHFAPEKNLADQIAAQHNIKYITADLDGNRADEKQDITQLTHGDDSFDAIICVHVLEHVPDDNNAMREMLRVLRPGGWALILVPIKKGLDKTLEDLSVTDPDERARLYGQSDHVRYYGKDFYDKLHHAGFQVSVYPFDSIISASQYTQYEQFTRDDMCLARKPILPNQVTGTKRLPLSSARNVISRIRSFVNFRGR